MSTEPKPESPAELAAEARRIAEAYGQAMYDAGMDANSDFSDRRYYSDRKRAEAKEELEADLSRLAAIATIQASKPVAKIINGNLAWNLAQPTDAVPVELLRGEHLLYTAATQARPESGEACERLRTLAHNVDEMCRDALRIPYMPWPDPHAHSADAYHRAVHQSFCDLRFKLMAIRNEANAAQTPAAPTSTPSAAKKD